MPLSERSLTMQLPRMTRRILVPLDGSDLGSVTIPHLRALATVESEILLLRVMPDPAPMLESAAGSNAAYREARQRNIAACHTHLQDIAAALRDVSPYIEPITTVGAPPDEIVRVAAEHRVDLILMATHDRNSADRFLVDSIANRVAQAAPVPVMMIHEHDGEIGSGSNAVSRYQRVVVPVDGSERARAAVPVALAIAERQKLAIRLLQAIPDREETFTCGDLSLAGDTEGEQGDWYGAWRAALAEGLEAEAAGIRSTGLDVSVELLTGPAAEAILEVVQPGDVIVMASHGAGGVRSWPLGTVAQKLASMAISPVVVVPVAERQGLTRIDAESRAG
jgi:nucleotide-binding universal stress UspA family protein